MNKELSKVVMNKSRLRNKCLQGPSRETFIAYKKMKNNCNTLTRKTKKRYFGYITKNKNFATTKTFWNTVGPFITNKGTISDENIKIKAEENQNTKIKNKNKNWSPLKQIIVLKTKVLKCSTIII